MTAIPRLQVLEHARELAELLGAVKDGTQFYEDPFRKGISNGALRRGDHDIEEVCGVCVAGACALSAITLGYDRFEDDRADAWCWVPEARNAAREVLNEQGYRDTYINAELSDALTDMGTPYLLAVLDRMIANEREHAAVPA